MPRLLTLLLTLALTGCAAGSGAPQRTIPLEDIPLASILSGPAPADPFLATVAEVLRGMSAPASVAVRDEAARSGLTLAVDPALPNQVLASTSNPDNRIALRDLGALYFVDRELRSVLRRLLEEELRHASDLRFLVSLPPAPANQEAYDLVGRMMVEANARVAVALAFAQERALDPDADFYLEPALCSRALLSALGSGDAAARREAARSIALDFLRDDGPYYIAFENDRMGGDGASRAVRDAAFVARVHSEAARLFTLPGDTVPYLGEADFVRAVTRLGEGDGPSAASASFAFSSLFPTAGADYHPCAY